MVNFSYNNSNKSKEKNEAKGPTINIPSCHYDSFNQSPSPSADSVTVEDLGKYTEYNPPIKETYIKRESYTTPFSAEPMSGFFLCYFFIVC
jgi:hypothetical protein